MAKGKYEYWMSEEGKLKLAAWARDGLTDDDIAVNMRISRSTLAAWKKKYQDISDTLKEGKDIADIRVENALYRKAIGGTYTEVTEERIEGKLVVTKRISKEIPGDTTAQIFWLKNRRGDRWKDKQNVALEGLEAEKSKLDDLIKQMRE